MGVPTAVPALRAASAAAAALLVLAACSVAPPPPTPRTVIVYSGERLQPDAERLQEVEQWVQPQLLEIDENPDFLIRSVESEATAYPWDTLEIVGDTAAFEIQLSAPDAQTPYQLYAHFHLMNEWGELHEWLPDLEEGEELEGYELEERILKQVSDAWLLGRSAFDTHPFGPMDELLYATERGLLREFILATQGDRFPEERAALEEDNPDWQDDLRAFFQRTFEREGPGYVLERRADGAGA